MSKAKPRQYGTGSVSQRAHDGLWVGAIMAGWTPEGKRRRIVVTGKTEQACIKALERKKKEIGAHGPSPVGARKSVKDWAELWLEQKVTQLRPNTFTDYESHVRHWIIPTIGHRKLEFVTPDDMRMVMAAVRAPDAKYPGGRTSSNARKVHMILKLLLKDAMEQGYPVAPRCLLTPAPALSANIDRDAIPTEQLGLLLRAAFLHQDGSRWFAAILQGMRQGECLGLTWDCVDLAGGTIDVSWQLQDVPFTHGCGPKVGNKIPCGRKVGGHCPKRVLRVPDGYEYRQLQGAWCLARPKTAKGRRVIPMVPWLAAALAHWKANGPTSPYGLVWPRLDGELRRPDDDTEAWKALQVEAGVEHPAGRPWFGHEARHATATMLLEAGIDPETVKAILGHSSITTSRGYQHVSQALARKAMDAVAARLELPA